MLNACNPLIIIWGAYIKVLAFMLSAITEDNLKIIPINNAIVFVYDLLF